MSVLKSWYEIAVNGATLRVEGEGVGLSLRDFLRGRGVTSVKAGCEERCDGGCTVIVDEGASVGEGSRYRAIASCETLLVTLAGKRVLTAEGIGEHAGAREVREAIVSSGATLCGYCGPGVMMTLFEAVHRGDLKSHRDLHEQLAGNVCRCTGYRSMKAAGVKAVRRYRTAADGVSTEKPAGMFDPSVKKGEATGSGNSEEVEELEGASGEFQYADAKGGRFYRPASRAELLMLLGQHREAVLVSGGTGVGARARLGGGEAMACVISTAGVEDLRMVAETEVSWDVGAGVRLGRVRELAAGRYPLAGEVLGGYSRSDLNAGTAGGLLMGDGEGALNEWAGVLQALGAQVRLASADGERESSVEQLLGKGGRVQVREGEVMVSLRFPRVKRGGARVMARHYRVRGVGGDVSVTGSFIVVLDSKKGKVEEASLVMGIAGVGMRPLRRTEKALVGKAWSEETMRGLLEGVRDEMGGKGRGDAVKRRQALNLFQKFYWEFEAGTGDRVLLGRSDLCLHPEEALVPGGNGGNGAG
ncbi:MAG: FAD binding domain-containing protein [Verrucomicrobiota bacterium]